MLSDLYTFSYNTFLSTQKNHLTGKYRHLSIVFVPNIRCTYLRINKINSSKI